MKTGDSSVDRILSGSQPWRRAPMSKTFDELDARAQQRVRDIIEVMPSSTENFGRHWRGVTMILEILEFEKPEQIAFIYAKQGLNRISSLDGELQLPSPQEDYEQAPPNPRIG